jgi:CheY-like chemotaxis protein
MAAKILLVDDKPENLVALEAALRPLEQDLVSCQSGEEALRCLLNDDFAVILLDVQMPGMDGFETAAQIKERERSRHIPIIFLTANSDPRAMIQGINIGARFYVTKPFVMKELIWKIRRVLPDGAERRRAGAG